MLAADASSAALWAIPLAAVVVSIATLVYTAIVGRRSADARHVEELESRVKVCETDRNNLRNEVELMGRREIQHLRMIVDLQERLERWERT